MNDTGRRDQAKNCNVKKEINLLLKEKESDCIDSKESTNNDSFFPFHDVAQ